MLIKLIIRYMNSINSIETAIFIIIGFNMLSIYLFIDSVFTFLSIFHSPSESDLSSISNLWLICFLMSFSVKPTSEPKFSIKILISSLYWTDSEWSSSNKSMISFTYCFLKMFSLQRSSYKSQVWIALSSLLKYRSNARSQYFLKALGVRSTEAIRKSYHSM